MQNDDRASAATLQSYLSRLEAELLPVPDSERRDILLETRSHVLERMERSPSRTIEYVLGELGPPNEYARRFLAELPAVVVAESRPTTLHGIARLATSGLKTFPLLCLVVFAYAIAVLAVLIAVDKIFEPAATGVFVDYVNGRRVFLEAVVGNPHARGHEVLGFWLVPIMFGVATVIHLLMRLLLRAVLRSQARN